MSAVDVLAVEYLKELAGDYVARRLVGTANEIDACAAAVAELVEADREYDEAHAAVQAYFGNGDSVYKRLDAAKLRRAAALARVAGSQP